MYTLSPAHERHFTSLRLVKSSQRVVRVARVLFCWLIVSIVAMALLPWQQTTRGSGRLVAYHPTERPQTIESPIYGRIIRWGDNIIEGARVEKDQMILEMRDNDPGRAGRLALQVLAVQEKLSLAQTKADTYARQVIDLTEAREQVIEAGRQMLEEARRKVEAEQHAVEGAEAAVSQTRINYERQRNLMEKGLTSGLAFEKERRSYEEAVAKKKAADRYVEAAQNYLQAKQAELEQKSREAQTKVDYARAMQQEALGEVALARKELAEMEGKQAQFESRVVTAPKTGIILRLMANDNAEMLKEGDPLFTIVPETSERAVELWIPGNDISLVTLGREVRLQFEGWPAVQFASGWPQLAFGTFGGHVAAIDATDNGKGQFRVLVRPDQQDPWPSEIFLRQGARANGWVMLSTVKLGFEIWRQLNGFPPNLEGYEDSGDKDVKKIKLPK